MPNHTEIYNQSLSNMLISNKLNKLWKKSHGRSDNPAQGIAFTINDIGENIGDHPELLSFMINLVDIELDALCQKHLSNEQKDILNTLELLEEYLKQLAEKYNLPDNIELPENYEKLLEVIRYHSGKDKLSPFLHLFQLAKDTAEHIVKDANDHPASFTALLSTSLGGLWFMNHRMGSSATQYIDPKVTTITDLSFEKMEELMQDSVTQLTYDPSLLNMKMEPSCHDHLTQIIGQSGADFIANTLGAANMFPQHCSKVKDLAFKAHESLNTGYNAITSRLEFFISDPAKILGDIMLPASPFKAAFDKAAHNAAEFIYAANTVENVVLHSIIFGSAIIGTVKLGTMEDKERQSIKNNMIDFCNRSLLCRPLNYLLMCSASAYSYIASHEITPDIVWMGAGGAITGEIIHKYINRRKAPELITNICHNSTFNIDKNEISRSSDIDNICGSNCAKEKNSDNKQNFFNGWKNFLKNPATIGTGTIVTATTLDIATTGGHITGNCLGALSVGIPFMLYNVPEDAALHIIFGFAGAIIGSMYIGAEKAVKAISKSCKSHHNFENEYHNDI